MTAFASELEVDIMKLKFSFDGDTIGPSQTALDLDMENDDCIDVLILSWTLVHTHSAGNCLAKELSLALGREWFDWSKFQ